MAYGDTPHDAMLKEAWEQFCDDLKGASSYIFDDPAPATAIDRARGFQYLTQNISLGLEISVEHSDPLYPDFFRPMTPVRKYGGDNPDCIYLRTFIDGSETYRISRQPRRRALPRLRRVPAGRGDAARRVRRGRAHHGQGSRSRTGTAASRSSSAPTSSPETGSRRCPRWTG